MNVFKNIKAYISEHKEEKGFKYTVIIIVLIILAIIANEWRDYQDRKELEQQQETAVVQFEEKPEENFLEEIWNESKFHFFVFTGLTAGLIAVKVRKSLKLEQTERKVEK